VLRYLILNTLFVLVGTQIVKMELHGTLAASINLLMPLSELQKAIEGSLVDRKLCKHNFVIIMFPFSQVCSYLTVT